VSGKTGSHALQGDIATHVHIAEAYVFIVYTVEPRCVQVVKR
jgi:hypothetical protein